MFWSILFLFELLALFFLSQHLSKTLFSILYRLTKNQEATIHALAFLFFPGVVLHELAHWFVAGILLVRTGEIEFFPKIQGNIVKLGSASIAKTDPFRRFLIGVAPLIIGIVAFFLVFYFFRNRIPGFNWQMLLAIYVYFEIGNTMFSSKKDMEGALGLFIGLVLVFVLLFYFGVRVHINPYSFLSFPTVAAFTRTTDLLLLIPIVGDIVILSVSKLISSRKYY